MSISVPEVGYSLRNLGFCPGVLVVLVEPEIA